MNIVHVKAAGDLLVNYSEISQLINNSDRVIITNDGKNEAVIIPFCEYERYEMYLHNSNIMQKLTEAELLADDPKNWINLDEMLKAWDNWGVQS